MAQSARIGRKLFVHQNLRFPDKKTAEYQIRTVINLTFLDLTQEDTE